MSESDSYSLFDLYDKLETDPATFDQTTAFLEAILIFGTFFVYLPLVFWAGYQEPDPIRVVVEVDERSAGRLMALLSDAQVDARLAA